MCYVLSRLPSFVCSYSWKPQYARFLVMTFIIIIGCFSFCIQIRWMAWKKLITLNVLMTVELSSLKIGKPCYCKNFFYLKSLSDDFKMFEPKNRITSSTVINITVYFYIYETTFSFLGCILKSRSPNLYTIIVLTKISKGFLKKTG